MPIIKIMEKMTTTAGHKATKNPANKFMRLLKIIFYFVAFCVINAGFYAHTVSKESPKTLVRYHTDNMPSSFPVLVTGMQDNGTPTVELEDLYIFEDHDEQTKLHLTLGDGEVQIDKYDGGYYRVEPISDSRKQIMLNIWVGGGDRKERYVYEVEGNRVYPKSFQVMSYFGWSFSAFPPALLTFLTFIFVCKIAYRSITKRMAVRKLKLTP